MKFIDKTIDILNYNVSFINLDLNYLDMIYMIQVSCYNQSNEIEIVS